MTRQYTRFSSVYELFDALRQMIGPRLLELKAEVGEKEDEAPKIDRSLVRELQVGGHDAASAYLSMGRPEQALREVLLDIDQADRRRAHAQDRGRRRVRERVKMRILVRDRAGLPEGRAHHHSGSTRRSRRS